MQYKEGDADKQLNESANNPYPSQEDSSQNHRI